ncbi:MAG: UvrD-helicase domain-containing protein, partial [Victivallaceae bacterium]
MREFNLLTHPLIAGKNSLIEASAGTGKTTAIENLILRLLLEGIELPGGGRKELSLQDILIVTFTEAATAELIQRVRENIAKSYNILKSLIVEGAENLPLAESGAAEQILRKYLTARGQSDDALKKAAFRLRLALLSFDESAISTIHGFCSRMLNDFAFESNLQFNLELIDDDGPFIQETADDYWRSNFYGKNCALPVAVAAAAGLSPGKLAELLRQTQKSVTLKVDGELDNLDDAIKTLENSYLGFAGLWQKENLTEVLKDNAENFLSAYKKKLNAGLPQIDKELKQNISGALFSQLNSFSKETLNGNLKKKTVWEINGQSTVGELPDTLNLLTEHADGLDAAAARFISAVKIDFIHYAQDRNKLAEKKLRLGVQSFDDLLSNMHKALKDSPGFAEKIRRRFPVAMIDEFQDTDPLQFEIFQDIFNHPDSLLLMVGDPKQSIYAFRGADIYSYLAVSNAMPETATLNKNYRSSEKLLHAFNTLFDVSNPFIEETIRFFPAEAGREQDKLIIDGDSIPEKPMKLWMLSESALSKNAAKKLAVQAVCAEIVAILNKARKNDIDGRPCARFESVKGVISPVRAGDIAVLTSSNKEALDISEQLAGCGIPAVLQHTGNVFESEEAISLFHLLRAIAEPGRETLLKTALATPLIGLNSEELTKLEQDDGIELLEYWQNIFHSLFIIWKERGFIQMFSRLLLPEKNRTDKLTKDIRCNLLSLPQGERRLTDLLHLSELIHQIAVKRKLSTTAIIAWLHEKIVHPEDCEEHERRLESDEDAVKVMTVHKSKGLQFPIVFCPFMWARGFYWSEYHRNKKRNESDFFFHAKNSENKYSLLFDAGHKKEKTEKNRLQYRKEKLAEQLRLLYVAVTRAKYYCCLTWGEIKETTDSSLAYLAREWTPTELNNLLYDGGKTFFGVNSLLGRKFYEWKESPCIKVEIPDCGPENFIPAQFKPELTAAELSQTIASDWGLMSFSSLTSGTHTAKDQLSGGDDETVSATLVAEELLIQTEQKV